MIGTILNEKYKVEKTLGRGAFGEVYRAHDIRLKRDVAIKVLLDVGFEDSFKNRFLGEAQAMAKLLHPNIAAVFDSGEAGNRPFLVMELVEGSSLLEAVESSPAAVRDVVRIGTQVCSGMAYAHERGIIHRDLTLRNILLTPAGTVKVVDFGLAKMMHSQVQSDPNYVVGTPMYLSPEQILGETVDKRCDIFSFGVCIYRMICGRFPFEAEHPASLFFLIAKEAPAPLDEHVPHDLRDVILRCLEKRPADRFATFDDLGVALSLLGKTESVPNGSITQTGVAAVIPHRGSKRNPYLNRVMIKNPDDFFGRTREVKKIFARLDAPHPQSISIVGERRLGKSSLLNFIYQRRNRRLFMQNYDEAIFAYMDFQGSHGLDIPKFIDLLIGMFNYERQKEIVVRESTRTLDKLKEVTDDLNKSGKRIIVLMDEFEAITRNPNFDMQFFSFLRYLANNYRVAFVTSSFQELQQMCHAEDIADSPFFNIFSNLPLRVFGHEEAEELIRVPSEREGIPLAPHSARIVALSGYFPLLIQIACSNVFEHLLEQANGRLDWGSIEKSFREEAWPHFAFAWDKMDGASRDALARAASRKASDRKLQHVIEDLLRRGYLRGTDGETDLFSEPFRDFVLEQVGGRRKGNSLFTLFRGKDRS
jgi:serine/threonine protein kinase